MKLRLPLLAVMLGSLLFGRSTPSSAEDDPEVKECKHRIRSEYPKKLSKDQKRELVKRVRAECVRKGEPASELYLDCKRLRLRQAETVGAKQAKKGLAVCRKLEEQLKAAPSDDEVCQTKACVRKGPNDICVFSYTGHGSVGLDFCRKWIALKVCATKQDELGGAFPDLLQWKAGKKEGATGCDEV